MTEKRFSKVCMADDFVELCDNGIYKCFNDIQIEKLLNEFNDENEQLKQDKEKLEEKLKQEMTAVAKTVDGQTTVDTLEFIELLKELNTKEDIIDQLKKTAYTLINDEIEHYTNQGEMLIVDVLQKLQRDLDMEWSRAPEPTYPVFKKTDSDGNIIVYTGCTCDERYFENYGNICDNISKGPMTIRQILEKLNAHEELRLENQELKEFKDSIFNKLERQVKELEDEFND